MDCLINYVGLIGSYDNPESYVFINSLPGITSEMLDKIRSSDHGQAADVFDDVQRTSAKRMYADLVSKLSAAYQLKTIREAVGLKPAADSAFGMVSVNPLNEYGIKIGFKRELRSLAALSISKVYFLSPDTYDANFTIYNDRHQVLFNIPQFNADQGLNEIPVNLVFTEDELYVVISPGPFSRFHTTKMKAVDTSCYCHAVRRCCGNNRCEPSLTGVEWDGLKYVDQGFETYGIGFDGDLVCDYSAIVCRNKPLFLSAWMYLLGNQILVELMASQRVNQPTTVDRDQYIELRDHYQLEYEKQLETLVKGINLSDSCCVVCNPPVKRKTWVP